MNAATTATPRTRLLKLAEVRQKVSLGRSTIYRMMANGRFPQPIRLTDTSVRWDEGELDAWIGERAQAN